MLILCISLIYNLNHDEYDIGHYTVLIYNIISKYNL